MTNFSFYPGDEDQYTEKAGAMDDLINCGPTEDDTDETEAAPDPDVDDLLDDDGIEEGEEIE